MKAKLLIIASIVISLLVAGCSHSGSATDVQSSKDLKKQKADK